MDHCVLRVQPGFNYPKQNFLTFVLKKRWEVEGGEGWWNWTLCLMIFHFVVVGGVDQIHSWKQIEDSILILRLLWITIIKGYG